MSDVRDKGLKFGSVIGVVVNEAKILTVSVVNFCKKSVFLSS